MSSSAHRLALAVLCLATALPAGCDEAPSGPTPPGGTCAYSVSPVEFTFHWHGAVPEGAGIAVTTTTGCSWTAGAGAGWITSVTPSEGAGAGIVRFTTSIHIDEASRAAPVQIRWPTGTAGVNVWVTQEGGRYALSQPLQNFTAAGGRGTTMVFGDPVSSSCPLGCPWTAVSSVPWLHVTSSMPRAGDDLLAFDVDANATGQERAGEIRLERVVVTVRQGG